MAAVPRNPYVAGNPVGGSSAFVGRDDVLRAVLRVLRHEQHNAIVLDGPRRIGTTAILQLLAACLPEEGPYCPVYFDLQDKAAWPLGRVLEDLAQTIAHALKVPIPDLGSDPETAFRDEWLPVTLDGLGKNSAVVLLLDEFDVLTEPDAGQAAKAFFPYLRGLLASDPGRLQFEFVIGRNIDDLDNIALSVFKGTPARRISLLDREDMASLVRLSERNGTLNWTDDAVERVWHWTHGHPFLTQQLCSHVWERAYDEEPDEQPTATPVAVDAAVPDALEASRNTMEWLWDGLPPAERVVAAALAEAGSAAITPEALARLLHDSGVRVVIRELQSAPQLLQDWDLIEPTDGGYRFRVELLRLWIAEQKPLRRVQEELDYIEPVAENLYQAALGLYQGGELEGAVDLLRRAVALNPNHVRANQLLADILLAKGNTSDAVDLLDRLYEYQPAAARPRLVQALLTRAQEATVDGEKLGFYERVLELEAAQPEAVAGKRRIWRRRGDAAFEAGDLEAALEAYQIAAVDNGIAKVQEAKSQRALSGDLRALEEAEQSGAYQQALDLARALASKYPEDRDWNPDLQRLELMTRLKDLYQRGLGALQSGDRPTAQTTMAQVVAIEPGYEEATRYLHLAVTGVDVVELQAKLQAERAARQIAEAASTPRFGWKEFGLLVVLTVATWVIGALVGTYSRGNVDSSDEWAAVATVGAIAGAVSGLSIAFILPRERIFLRWVYVVGGGITAAFVWVVSEALFNSDGPKVGAIIMAIGCATVILWRVLGARRMAEEEMSLQERLEEGRQLCLWNPLDHVRLVWWVLVKPQCLRAYREAFGSGDEHRLGKWLVSTLIWSPLFLAALGVLLDEMSFSAVSPLVIIGLVVAWTLTGWLGDRCGKWQLWGAGAVGFVVAGAATLVISQAVARHVADELAQVMAPAVALILALGVVCGMAFAIANGVAAGVSGGVPVGLVVGLIVALLTEVFYGHLEHLLVCIAAGIAAALVAFLVARSADSGLQHARPSWVARLAFFMLLLFYAAFIWLGFLRGYHFFD